MGKNLKGREWGKGIYQRKDGLYSARFVDRAGKRHEKYFQTVSRSKKLDRGCKVCGCTRGGFCWHRYYGG